MMQQNRWAGYKLVTVNVRCRICRDEIREYSDVLVDGVIQRPSVTDEEKRVHDSGHADHMLGEIDFTIYGAM